MEYQPSGRDNIAKSNTYLKLKVDSTCKHKKTSTDTAVTTPASAESTAASL